MGNRTGAAGPDREYTQYAIARVRREGGIFYDEDYAERAACKDKDLSMFFPGRGETTRETKEICAGCPVRYDCLMSSLQVECSRDMGIFGGLSPNARREVAFTLGVKSYDFDPMKDYWGSGWAVNLRNYTRKAG